MGPSPVRRGEKAVAMSGIRRESLQQHTLIPSGMRLRQRCLAMLEPA